MTYREPDDPNVAPPADGGGWGAEHGGAGGRNGMGTAALVLGILALLLAVLFFPLGILLGIVAVVLGVIGRTRATRREATNGGVATAGLVTGALAIVLGGLIAVLVGNFLFDNAEELSDLSDCLTEAGDDTAAQDECRTRFEGEIGAPAAVRG